MEHAGLPLLPEQYIEKLNTNRNKQIALPADQQDGALTDSFIRLSDSVIGIDGLNSTDKLIYSIIESFARSNRCCYAGNGYLAGRLGVSRSTVTRSLGRLERMGMIRREIHRELGNARIIEAMR